MLLPDPLDPLTIRNRNASSSLTECCQEGTSSHFDPAAPAGSGWESDSTVARVHCATSLCGGEARASRCPCEHLSLALGRLLNQALLKVWNLKFLSCRCAALSLAPSAACPFGGDSRLQGFRFPWRFWLLPNLCDQEEAGNEVSSGLRPTGKSLEKSRSVCPCWDTCEVSPIRLRVGKVCGGCSRYEASKSHPI